MFVRWNSRAGCNDHASWVKAAQRRVNAEQTRSWLPASLECGEINGDTVHQISSDFTGTAERDCLDLVQIAGTPSRAIVEQGIGLTNRATVTILVTDKRRLSPKLCQRAVGLQSPFTFYP